MVESLRRKRHLPILLLLWTVPLFAQTAPESAQLPVEEEAPESLWEGRLGDRNVEVQATGTWDLDFLGGTGFSVTAAGLQAPVPFPGLTIGWLFSQSPLLNLSIRMDQRYFFRVDYQGEWRNSSFLIGYEGLEGEHLRWIKGGTAPFSIPVYGDWVLGESQKGSLQAALGWDSSFSRHDLLVRREAGVREHRHFRGDREVRSFTWSPDLWSREEFYRLPTSPVRNLRIYVEDQSGIRDSAPGEWAWNEDSGTLRPLAWKGHKAYVTWDGISLDSLPEGFSAALPGKPGIFFVIPRGDKAGNAEAKNIYRTPEGNLSGEVQYGLRYRGSDTAVTGPWVFEWNPEGRLTVLGSGGSSTPFDSLLPGLYQGLPTNAQDYELWVEILSEQEGITLGPQVIPGSLEVTYNGVVTGDYQFNPAEGTLVFPFPVFSQDKITVSYEIRSEGSAKILGAQGNRWNFSQNHWLDAGLQSLLTWEIGSWTNNSGEKPGTAEVFIQHRWNSPDFTSSLTMKASGGFPDFTGLLRWYGAEGSPYTAPLDTRYIRPSPPPSRLADSTDPAYSLPGKSNRGKLIYRDFSYRDFSGYQGYRPYSPDASSGSYGNGSYIGPYITGGFEGQVRTLLATEFRLGAGQWAGAQVFFDEGRVRDLSTMSRLNILLRWASPKPEGVKIFLQLGELGEDLDSSGTINAPRTSPSGLPFSHGEDTLIIPMEESSLKSEDWESKGWLRPEPNDVLSWEITGDLSETWTAPLAIDLTTAQRPLLERVNAYRLIILAPSVLPLGVEELQGVILSSAPVLEGTTFKTDGPVFLESSHKEAPWTPPGNLPASRLQPENKGRLTVDWDTSGWSGRTWNTPVPSGDYRWFAFFARNGDPQPFSAEAHLADSLGNGPRWTFTLPGDGAWHMVRVDLVSGETFLDDVPQTPALPHGAPAAYTDFSITMTGGAESGSLQLDEFHFYDSIFQAGARAQWSGVWKGQPTESLKLEGRWDVKSRTEGSAEALPSLSVTWGPLSLEVDSDINVAPGRNPWSETGFLTGFKVSGLQVSHRFRENSWREDRIIWQPSELFQGKTDVKVQFFPTQTRQDWGGSLEAGDRKSGLWTSLQSGILQISSPAPFQGSSLWNQYAGSWLYLPWNQDQPSGRSGNAGWKSELSLGPLTLSSHLFSSAGHTLLKENFQTGMTAGTRWASHASDLQSWIIGLEWHRTLSGTRPPAALEGWPRFLSAWADRWVYYGTSVFSAPGREWWSESPHLPGTLASEDLKSSYHLKISRPRTLTWWDLAPALFESVLQKEAHREGSYRERWSWDNLMEIQLVNGFGSKGYLGPGLWYDTDKVSIKGELNLKETETGDRSAGGGIRTEYTFWAGSHSLGLQNSLKSGGPDISSTSQLWFEFSADAPAQWKFPYITPPKSHIPKLIHRISLQHAGMTGRPLVSLLAEWNGRWEFDPGGAVKASFKWGQEWKSERYNTIFQAGTGLSLSF